MINTVVLVYFWLCNIVLGAVSVAPTTMPSPHIQNLQYPAYQNATVIPPRLRKRVNNSNNNGTTNDKLKSAHNNKHSNHHNKATVVHKFSSKPIEVNRLYDLFVDSIPQTLIEYLPRVVILPITDAVKDNVKVNNHRNAAYHDNHHLTMTNRKNIKNTTSSTSPFMDTLDTMELEMNYAKHEQDILFYLWLKHKYSKTIDEKQSMKPTAKISSKDLFFIPTSIPQDSYGLEKERWIQLDDSLGTVKNDLKNVTLNHGFIAGATHPNTLVLLRAFYPQVRNIADLFVLRVDGDNSLTHSRNIFVPYITNVDMKDFHSYDEQRKYFIMAACRETLFHKDPRYWRSVLYDHWHKKAPRSNITLFLTHQEFDDVLKNSEFCVVTPGDTISSSKLYKALFYGCIPIIFVSYYAQLPFHYYIKWSKFAIIVYKDNMYDQTKMERLLQHILDLRQNETMFREYRKNVESVRHLFDYYRYEWPSVYHLTLLEVVRRSQRFESEMFVSN